MLRARPARAQHLAPIHQVILDHHRSHQQQRCQQHQPKLAKHAHQQGAHGRPDQPADTGTGSNEGEQPACLRRVEHIGHQAPGHRHHKQVVDRDPHIEHPCQPDAVVEQEEQRGEQQQVAAEEAVHPVDVMNARHPRVEPGEQRHGQQHGKKSRGEQPLQVVDAPLNPHGLTNRSQHEVAGEQAEEKAEPSQCRTQLTGTGIDRNCCARSERLH